MKYKIFFTSIIVSAFLFFLITSVAWITEHSLKKGKYTETLPARIILYLASIPSISKQLIGCHVLNHMDDCKGLGGKEFLINNETKLGFKYLVSEDDKLSGYLLISRYFVDEKLSKVQLLRVNNGEVVHEWLPDIDSINSVSKVDRKLVPLERDKGKERYLYFHPFITVGGDLIFKTYSPLVRVDSCSNLVWQIDELFHHSIEQDYEKNIWVPTLIKPGKYGKIDKNFHDDQITKVRISDGKILYQKSVAEILEENKILHLATSSFVGTDPLHLNDIEPVIKDTKYWKRGDVFLSLRGISLLLLFRPEENRLIWYKQGNWRHQHDIDIIDDKTIGIFNNNRDMNNLPSSEGSEIVYINFETGDVTSEYEKLFKNEHINSATQSLFSILENNDIFVEDQNNGKIYRASKNGDIRWKYEWNALINWSRFIDEEAGAIIISNIKKNKCE